MCILVKWSVIEIMQNKEKKKETPEKPSPTIMLNINFQMIFINKVSLLCSFHVDFWFSEKLNGKFSVIYEI